MKCARCGTHGWSKSSAGWNCADCGTPNPESSEAPAAHRPIVVVESPYAGDLERNARYLDACLLDSLRRGEAPFASHGLYTRPGVLCDAHPAERQIGIEAGFSFRRVASRTVLYEDLGISEGMRQGIADSIRTGVVIEYRKLGGEWS